MLFKYRQSVMDAAYLRAKGASGRDDAEDHQHGGDERRPLLHKASHSTTRFPKQNRASLEVALQEYSHPSTSSSSSKDSSAITVAVRKGLSKLHSLTDCPLYCQGRILHNSIKSPDHRCSHILGCHALTFSLTLGSGEETTLRSREG